MSRPLRIEYPDAWYHVMNRGRRGESVFRNKVDYLTFIELLKKEEACRIYGVGMDELHRSRTGISNERRDVVIYLMRALRGDNLEKIGRSFNMNRFSSVSSVVERMRCKISGNGQLRNRVEKIKTATQLSQTEI